MGRRAHLVGSIPGTSAAEAMDAALTRLAPYLLTLSDGETGLRAGWIGLCLRNLADNPDLELVGGVREFVDYETVLQYRLRPGGTLTVGNLAACLPYAAAFQQSFPAFRALRDRHGRPDLPFQVGIPAHLDLSVDAFGFPNGLDPAYFEPSLAATASQVRQIGEAGGSDVVFQLETPAGLISVATAAAEAAPETARNVAMQLAELPAAVPAGTRFGVHLCLGDLNHKAMATMPDIMPAVLLANELAVQWPADQILEFIHIPFAAAEEPPTFSHSFYEPLALLDLPAPTHFVAGCIHESLSSERQIELLRLIEHYIGREADVAAACGLGRRPEVAQAWDAMEKALLLIGSG
jgi:hypothetical protein